jgi:hypothetical protein
VTGLIFTSLKAASAQMNSTLKVRTHRQTDTMMMVSWFGPTFRQGPCMIIIVFRVCSDEYESKGGLHNQIENDVDYYLNINAVTKYQ